MNITWLQVCTLLWHACPPVLNLTEINAPHLIPWNIRNIPGNISQYLSFYRYEIVTKKQTRFLEPVQNLTEQYESRNSEHTIHQKQEGKCWVSYDTCHEKGKKDSPLDSNNTKIDISMTNNITQLGKENNMIWSWWNDG